MRFIVDIPDRAKEDMINLSMAAEGKMVYNGFNISLEEKILILMVRSMQRGEGLAVPLDHERYPDLESLKGIDHKKEMIVAQYVLPEQPVQKRQVGSTCSQCEGAGEIDGACCPTCGGSGR